MTRRVLLSLRSVHAAPHLPVNMREHTSASERSTSASVRPSILQRRFRHDSIRRGNRRLDLSCAPSWNHHSMLDLFYDHVMANNVGILRLNLIHKHWNVTFAADAQSRDCPCSMSTYVHMYVLPTRRSRPHRLLIALHRSTSAPPPLSTHSGRTRKNIVA